MPKYSQKETAMQGKDSSKKTAAILSAFLVLVLSVSLIAVLPSRRKAENYVAEIYQNGELIRTLDLEKDAPQIFTIEGDNHCENEIEVRQGSIAVISADCPDKLCVGQGFISDSRIPITCLPNRLVILLILADESGVGTPDAATY
jgi:hypothetical protein